MVHWAMHILLKLKPLVELLFSHLLLDAECCTIIWHRVDKIKEKTQGEMLKLAVVVVSDR